MFPCSLSWTERFGTAKLVLLAVAAPTGKRRLLLVDALRMICCCISIRKGSGVNSTRSKWIITFLLRSSLRKDAAGQFKKQNQFIPFWLLASLLLPNPSLQLILYSRYMEWQNGEVFLNRLKWDKKDFWLLFTLSEIRVFFPGSESLKKKHNQKTLQKKPTFAQSNPFHSPFWVTKQGCCLGDFSVAPWITCVTSRRKMK